MSSIIANPPDRLRRVWLAGLGLLAFFGMALGLSAQDSGEKKDKDVKPALDEGKDGKKIKPAQMAADDDKAADAAGRSRHVVRLGYTRPGNPPGEVKDGALVRPIFFHKGKIIGGTVYFMVLERLDRDFDRDRNVGAGAGAGSGDTWGSGMGDLDNRFVEGRNFDGGVSPRLDTKARYLYLYQVVNDRDLDPTEPKAGLPANFGGATDAREVASFALRILPDPRAITSWGHFQGSAFTAVAPDRNIIGQVRLAADNSEQKIRLAVSDNPSITGELPQRAYRLRSPAYSLGKLAPSFAVGADNLNLAKSFNHTYLEKNKGVIQAAFVGNTLRNVEGGKEPDYVQLMYLTGGERILPGALAAAPGAVDGQIDVPGVPAPGVDDSMARAIFRADWRGNNLVRHGNHSVVFGFTTDLPPVNEPLRIADLEAALQGGGIAAVVGEANIGAGIVPAGGVGVGAGQGQAVGVGAGAGAGIGFAVGTGVTPVATQTAAAGGGGIGGGYGSMGGAMGGGMGGGGFGFPFGGIGGARGGATGGGTGGGTGSGQGNNTAASQQQQKEQQQQKQQQQGSATPANQFPFKFKTTPSPAQFSAKPTPAQFSTPPTPSLGTKAPSINISITNTNQQQQNQQQQQQQQQQQSQSSCGCNMPPHNVVPAPASALLALLGLPGLYFLRRRPLAPSEAA